MNLFEQGITTKLPCFWTPIVYILDISRNKFSSVLSPYLPDGSVSHVVRGLICKSNSMVATFLNVRTERSKLAMLETPCFASPYSGRCCKRDAKH